MPTVSPRLKADAAFPTPNPDTSCRINTTAYRPADGAFAAGSSETAVAGAAPSPAGAKNPKENDMLLKPVGTSSNTRHTSDGTGVPVSCGEEWIRYLIVASLFTAQWYVLLVPLPGLGGGLPAGRALVVDRESLECV